MKVGLQVHIPGSTLTGTVIGVRRNHAAMQVGDYAPVWWECEYLWPAQGAPVVFLSSSWLSRLGVRVRRPVEEGVVGR